VGSVEEQEGNLRPPGSVEEQEGNLTLWAWLKSKRGNLYKSDNHPKIDEKRRFFPVSGVFQPKPHVTE